MSLGKVDQTSRGFEIVSFEDCYNKECSLQMSSLAVLDRPGTSAVWLGQGESRMHLNRNQVEALIEHLQAWLEKDTFKVD